jgi:hypothetical protein
VKLNTNVITALADPTVQGRLAPLGYETRPDAPVEFWRWIELWSPSIDRRLHRGQFGDADQIGDQVGQEIGSNGGYR